MSGTVTPPVNKYPGGPEWLLVLLLAIGIILLYQTVQG